MCGIAGFIQRRSPEPHIIERMLKQIRHRGPDGQGIWTGQRNGWHITLGHRRLAVLDIEGGHQPLANETGDVRVTYNGEIYNFAALRTQLERAGHRFTTRCDTEVIVHQHEEHGPAGIEQFDGMFAFGIWDQRDGSLTLARDRVGIKPLYYAMLPDGGIVFASELTALLAHPDVEVEIDPAGLACYFCRDYVHPPETIVRGVRKVPPAHWLRWRDGDVGSATCFSTFDASPSFTGSIDEATNLLRPMLRRAVRAQMVSDVPIGVFLSGGIDSSLVAAIAQQATSQRLSTFTIGFEDPSFDESSFARQVATHIGSQHIEDRFTEDELLGSFDDALNALDEPMADASMLPTYALSRLAARHVKVVLGGDGGDELWAGYPTYKAHRMASIYARLPRPFRRGLIEPLVARLPTRDGYQTLEWKAKRFALRWDDVPEVRHLRWMSNVDLPELDAALESPERWSAVLSSPKLAGGDVLNRILQLDLQTYLPGSVLTKVDRASMAHGLEVRPPLLARELVEFAFSLPSDLKMRGLQTKALLKQAASAWLPREIVHRRKKGFAIPLARWLRGPLRERVELLLARSPIWNLGLLRQETFAGWWRAHERKEHDHARPLYAAIVFDHWLRRMQQAASKRTSKQVLSVS